MRGVTVAVLVVLSNLTFQLTRLMRGVTYFYTDVEPTYEISTHTPHARRDKRVILLILRLKISTHTPHARRDFLHLLSMLDVTISTHTPHARRDNQYTTNYMNNQISTHTPHARRDKFVKFLTCIFIHFNSHASCEA